MAYDLKAKIAEAAKTGPNMNEAQAGGEYTPPAAGIARARFVGYYELGTHEGEYQGKKKETPKVDLVFELSGPNHEPHKKEDGTLVPVRITANENLHLNDKAHFFKLFAAMNAASGGTATHMAELLGKAFIVEIFHSKSKDGKRTYANLRGPNGYNVKGTTVQDPLTGKPVLIEVAPAISDVKAFIWDLADKAMWDSIFIEGEYPERKDEKTGEIISKARSKNVIQEKIMSAKNWKAHPLAAIVAAGGQEPDLPEAETPERSTPENEAAADPLAAIG
ncbi:hypothetical protein [Burkholderia sp. AU45388]|uniref:hypothetical protein n=1 Tax=Burkholderia sp. AU45388 TaxID=3059206 RepID=UPI00264DAEC6|nr:hypothetical protein [Burkholderia sp. AU45388]MDN7427800.1 hypothetical protein [Burkholderia sp. AU45388]